MASHRNNLRRPAPRRGFTLLELVLVMLLICIMAGMAAPMFDSSSSGRQVSNAARQFVAVARYAHDQAVSRGRVIRLNVDTAGAKYWLTVEDGAAFARLDEEFGRDFYFPDGVAVDCDAPQQPDGRYVEFQPGGRSDPANLRLTSGDGQVTYLGSPSATELFTIFPPDQAPAWGVWAQQKKPSQAGGGR